MCSDKPARKPTKIPGVFFSFHFVTRKIFPKNIPIIAWIILPGLLLLPVLLTACGLQATPALSPEDIERTAVAAEWTMMAVESQDGTSTITPLPRTPTPLPSTTPMGFPTLSPSTTPGVVAQTPNPTQTLRAAFSEIDSQFENLMKGNIAFNKPDQMKRGAISSIELILSPSLSESALATQLVERGGFVTSTADPNILIAPNGESVTIETSQIEIAPRLKAVLLPQDPDAFIIKEMHDNAEQVVSPLETTTWRWSVTARKAGSQRLELVIYQLVKYDGREFWPEVETYKADIVVKVTPLDQVKFLDWKWLLGFMLSLVGSVLGVLSWISNRRKKAEEEKSVKETKKKKKHE